MPNLRLPSVLLLALLAASAATSGPAQAADRFWVGSAGGGGRQLVFQR